MTGKLLRNARGFTMMELIVVCVVIGIMSAIALPMFLSYYRSAILRAGAEEVMVILNDGRQLAINQNTTVCVSASTTSLQFHIGSCASATYTGPGTDSSGNIKFQSPVQITNNPGVTFSYLGGATVSGSYTVQNPVNSATMTVTVNAAGRISIP
jgi:prepilin-type N-terminal cleavage/methylation domain-containing protein